MVDEKDVDFDNDNDRDYEGRDNDTREGSDRDSDDLTMDFTDTDMSDSESDFDEALDDTIDTDMESSAMFDFSEFADDDEEKKDDFGVKKENPDTWDKIKEFVGDQKKQISDSWNETKDTVSTAWDTISSPFKEAADRTKQGLSDFAKEYPVTAAIGEGYNTVHDKVQGGIESMKNAIDEHVVEPVRNYVDEHISQPINELNKKIGTANTLSDDENALYTNPNNTWGAINWHARENPSMWDGSGNWNTGPVRLDVMTNDMWNNLSDFDQQYITEHFGQPALVQSVDELHDWISDKKNGIIDGINPLLTKEDVTSALEAVAKAQGTTLANTYAMSPDEFKQYMSEPVFNIDSLPADATTEDILTAIDGELARRSLLSGSGFWVNAEERGQGAAYANKVQEEGGLTITDLQALKSAIQESEKAKQGPDMASRLSAGVSSFFLPGATSVLENQAIAKASFDPKAVLKASKENNIPVGELLKMRADAIQYNNPEKAIKYFELTGDTLNNARVHDYIGSIIYAASELEAGRMSAKTAALYVEYARAEALANKTSDVWNNDVMTAIKKGVAAYAIGAAAGVALSKGTQAAINTLVKRVGSGNATRVEQAIAKYISGNKYVRNRARYDAMRDAFQKGNVMERDDMYDMLEMMYEEAVAAGDTDAAAMFAEDLKKAPGARVGEELAEQLNAIATASETPEWFMGMASDLGYANKKDFIEAAAKALGGEKAAKGIAAGIGAGVAGSGQKASAGVVQPKVVDTITQEAPAGIVNKVNDVAASIPDTGIPNTAPDTPTDTNTEPTPTDTTPTAEAQSTETEESFKNSPEAQQAARDLAEELTPGFISNPTTRKEMLENAERISGIDFTERARWLNDMMTDSDRDVLWKTITLNNGQDEEVKPVIQSIVSFAKDVLGASVSPVGFILTIAKELPAVLTMLGFEEDTVSDLQGIHDRIASQEQDYDPEQYQQREELGDWGFTNAGIQSEGNKSNAERAGSYTQVPTYSDADVKKFITHIVRQEPYVRVMIRKWTNDKKPAER